jgi:hypothetical protein
MRRWLTFPVLILGLAATGLVISRSADPAGQSIQFCDDFESGELAAWEFPYPEDWEARAEAGNHFLHMLRSREPGVPRRPLQFARLKQANVGSFVFEARLRREGRSMIVVFNYVDTLHFYYAHFSSDRGTEQPVHNGVFIVNGEPRKRIAGIDAPPALPDREWHKVRIARDAGSGAIEVFVDGQKEPLFSVVDRTFTCGQISIGSFDETGDFDDISLSSNDAGCSPGGQEPLLSRGAADRACEGRLVCKRPALESPAKSRVSVCKHFRESALTNPSAVVLRGPPFSRGSCTQELHQAVRMILCDKKSWSRFG